MSGHVKLKFCGLRRDEDISYANETKPDYAGFIFAQSKRFVPPEKAVKLKSQLDKSIKTVGVFVNLPIENLGEYADAADIFQLHGDEDSEYIKSVRRLFPEKEIWKAVRLRDVSDIEKAAVLDADKYVLDAFSAEAYGGTGKRIDEDLLYKAKEILRKINKPFFIAGGIDESNIAETAKKFEPFGIDLSSGIETDGFKDETKMKNIITILREENLR